MTAGSGDLPLFVVVGGTPTDEEIAALTAVLAARARSDASCAAASSFVPASPSQWSNNARAMRLTLRPGPGAWRASAWRR